MLFYRLNFNDGTYITMLTPEAMDTQITASAGDVTISALPCMYICIRPLDTLFSVEKIDLLGNVWKFELLNGTFAWYFNGRAIATLGTTTTGFYYLTYNPETGYIALDGVGTPTVPHRYSECTFALNGNTDSALFPTVESCVNNVVEYVLADSSGSRYGCVFDIRDTADFYPIRNLTLYMVSGGRTRTFYEFFRLRSPNGSTSGYVDLGDLSDTISVLSDVPDPYEYGGNTEPSEMTGDFDDESDPIDFPSLPILSAVDTGLITLYNPTLPQIKDLAAYMWTNPAFDISAWKKIFADPIDAILGLSIVPVSVPDGGVRPIAVGNLLTDVSMNVAATQYVEVQCGSLNVNEFWSSYLDYDPYTKAEIYLPYCGIRQLSVDDIMNKRVEVRYHIDILTGSCCAYVKCGESVLYQFIGQCSSSIPVASGDFSEIVASALNAALAVGSVIATGGASAPFALPAYTSNAVNILKEKIQKSGSLSGTGGMLGIQKPYLILTRPRQAHPEKQSHYTGYPSFITEKLSTLSGYTEIESIHLENVPATDAELTEIETLLKGGVIL